MKAFKPEDLIEVDIDSVPYGTTIYHLSGRYLGVVERHLAMNGNRRHQERRHLNTGLPEDRFAYRRDGMYQKAKAEQGGKVQIRRNVGESNESN